MHALVCPLCRIALPPTEQVCPRDGHTGRAVAWLAVPDALRTRFRELEPFAHGDGGSLYIADEPETGRRGLLKLLAPTPRAQQAEHKRLRRELVKQSTLARSHLLLPYASGDVEGLTWIFREWLDGVSLEVRLSRGGLLSQTEALAIAAQIATALDELHRGGLLHRDVKPGHILLQPTSHGIPRAFLIDAGVASPFTARDALLSGTPGYVAPEQLLGSLVSFRSDLYSLGCVLFRMLTGRPAFHGETPSQMLEAQRVGELPALPRSLPPGIGTLLQSILARDPQERPFSAQKLRRTLEPFLPDGALMEKQPTSTFEVVPEGPPTGLQPSGTLRPPAPSAPSPHLGTKTLLGSSGLQQAAAAVRRMKDERTEQLELAQLEELPSPKRSVPPPTPAAAISDKTQPLRLDQILAVADSRRRSNRPPPLTPSEPPRAAQEPDALRPTPVSESPHELLAAEALRSARSSEAQPSVPSAAPRIREPLFAPPASAHHDASPAASRQDAAPPTAQRHNEHAADDTRIDPVLDDDRTPLGVVFPNEPSDGEDTVVSSSLEGLELDSLIAASAAVAPVSTAEPLRPAPHKATLVGLGGVPSSPESVVTRAQRDVTTEPMPVIAPDDDSSPGTRRSGLGAALPLSSSFRLDSRRALMIASAALVGIAVLGVAVSGMMSSPAPVAETTLDAPTGPAPLPAVAAHAAEPEAAATPEPTTEALAGRANQAPPPKAEPTAEPAPAASEPAPTKRAEAPRATKSEAAPSDTRRTKRGAREASKSTTSAPAKPTEDKSALFAEAREEARLHYAAKRFKQAAAAYERATRYDPGHAGTYAGLGAARLQTGDNQGALQAYQRAAQLAPETAGFHAALGRAYLANGDKARAKTAYARALTLDPNNESAKNALKELGR